MGRDPLKDSGIFEYDMDDLRDESVKEAIAEVPLWDQMDESTFLDLLADLLYKAYFNSLKRAVQMNKNRIIALTGQTGSGKSWAALRYAYEIMGDDFPLENIVFTPQDFLDRVDKSEKGSVIIFDEVGVGAQARKWFTRVNQAISTAAQVFRYKNQIIILTVPFLRMADVNVRMLVHEFNQVLGYDEDEGFTHIKIFDYQYNEIVGKAYYKYPRFKLPFFDDPIPLEELLLPAPPEWITKEYEKMQYEYKQYVLEKAKKEAEAEIEEALTGHEKRRAMKRKIKEEILQEILDDPRSIGKYLSEWKGKYRFSASTIAAIFGTSKGFAMDIANWLNYDIFEDRNGWPKNVPLDWDTLRERAQKALENEGKKTRKLKKKVKKVQEKVGDDVKKTVQDLMSDKKEDLKSLLPDWEG